MQKQATISVGIPSQGLLQRRDLIWEAIRSVVSQEQVSVRCYLILNGNRCDPHLRQQLEQDTTVTVIQSNETGPVPARRLFRKIVDTEFFCYLDDDDILLPGALYTRARPMLDNQEIDAVLTNGWVQGADSQKISIDNFMCFPDDIRLAALTAPILSANNHLFRTSSVGSEILNVDQNNFEWLLIGVQLALSRNILRLDQKTFVYRHGSSEQMTQSLAFFEDYPIAWEKIKRMKLTKEMKAIVGPKLATAYGRLAIRKMEDGDIPGSWRAFLSCISTPHGLRYLPVLRTLVIRTLTG